MSTFTFSDVSDETKETVDTPDAKWTNNVIYTA